MEEQTKVQLRAFSVHPVFVGVATMFLGWAAFQLFQWNTSDSEIIPRVEVLEDVAQQQVQINRSLNKAVMLGAIEGAERTIRVTSVGIARLQAKPKEEWMDTDHQAMSQFIGQQERAMGVVRSMALSDEALEQ